MPIVMLDFYPVLGAAERTLIRFSGSHSTSSAAGGPVRRRLIDRDVKSDSLKNRTTRRLGITSADTGPPANCTLPEQHTAEGMTAGETGIQSQKEQSRPLLLSNSRRPCAGLLGAIAR